MKTSPTLTEIIQQAEMQLDGIGLNDTVRDEATAELERDLEHYAGEALWRVLQRHIAPLAPAKKRRKSSRSASEAATSSAMS